MTPKTQQEIIDATTRLFAEVSEALGRQASGYEEGIRFLQDFGDKTVFELLLAACKSVVPFTGGSEVTLTAQNLHLFLGMMDTREKAETILATLPEPDPALLIQILKEVSSMLPSIRRVLYPFAKKLPPPPGGRPRKLAEPETRQAIRDEIGRLFALGVDLKDAQTRLANREDVSLSTIQRIWAERKMRITEPKSN